MEFIISRFNGSCNFQCHTYCCREQTVPCKVFSIVCDVIVANRGVLFRMMLCLLFELLAKARMKWQCYIYIYIYFFSFCEVDGDESVNSALSVQK